MPDIFVITIEVESDFDSNYEYAGIVHTGTEHSTKELVHKLNENLDRLKSLARLKDTELCKKKKELNIETEDYLDSHPDVYPPLPNPPTKGSGETSQEFSVKLKAAKKMRAETLDRVSTELSTKINKLEEELKSKFMKSIADIDFVSKELEVRWATSGLHVGDYSWSGSKQV